MVCTVSHLILSAWHDTAFDDTVDNGSYDISISVQTGHQINDEIALALASATQESVNNADDNGTSDHKDSDSEDNDEFEGDLELEVMVADQQADDEFFDLCIIVLRKDCVGKLNHGPSLWMELHDILQVLPVRSS